jgi:hypothetical protein
MAIALGLMALRQGAAMNFIGKSSLAWRAYFGDEENRRTLLLIGIIFVYVLLVDRIAFDKESSIGGLSIFFSSYELISIAVLSLILRIFWQAPLPKCLGVSFAVVVALASAFRYGFKILLPGLA